MQQAIEFVDVTRENERFDRPDSFGIRKDRPHLWLQKVCVFIMRKLGAFDVGNRAVIRRKHIDADSFVEKLFQQSISIQKNLNRQPTRILVGAEDYADMMEEMAEHYPFSFEGRYRYSDGQNTYIRGMKVEVIPWMKGILVMPEGM